MSVRRHVRDGIVAMTRRLGFEPVRYTARNVLELRRRLALEQLGITLVLDVGASRGEYGRELRQGGYAGRIVSFEPVEASYAALARTSAADPDWQCRHVALGQAAGAALVNVAANLRSSSLRPMAARHLAAEPGSAYLTAEEIAVARLDDLLPEFSDQDDRIMLKLDVQGFEGEVLRGAAATLELVELVEAELSLVELYEGQALAHEIIGALWEAGFAAVALEPAFRDRTSPDLLGLDGLFVRRGA